MVVARFQVGEDWAKGSTSSRPENNNNKNSFRFTDLHLYLHQESTQIGIMKLLILLALVGAVVSACDDGWSGAFGNCYRVIEDDGAAMVVNKAAAMDTCKKFNSKILEVWAEEEYKWVTEKLWPEGTTNPQKVWLGMITDEENMLNKYWYEVSNKYENYAVGKENPTDEKKCRLRCGKVEQWGYVKCTKSFPTICEKAMDATLGSCEDKWQEFNGRCYRACDKNVSYADAEAKCLDKDASIASVRSAEHEAFLAGLSSTFWIQLKKPEPYINWMEDPSGDGLCTEIHRKPSGELSGMNDLSCGRTRGIICMK